MKSKRILVIGVIIGVLLAFTFVVQAGYQSAPEPIAAKVQALAQGKEVSVIVDRTAWVGGVVLEDGKKIVLENAGGYFLPVELPAGIRCEIWISGAGLVSGRVVTLFTMHGGLINGKVQDEVAVGEDSVLRFEFHNGTFGAQPIQATVFGTISTLLTVMVAQ